VCDISPGFPKRNSYDNPEFGRGPVEKPGHRIENTQIECDPLVCIAADRIPKVDIGGAPVYLRAEGVTFAFSLPHWNFNPARTLVGRLT
jgi:hypothetical protein